MREHALGAMELRFAELIWAHEPIGSGELVYLAAETFGWKNRRPTRCCGGCANAVCFKTKAAWYARR